MSSAIEVDISRWIERSNRFLDILGPQLAGVLRESCGVIRDTMYWIAPYREGKLAASITIEDISNGVAIGPNVPYAVHVSRGTQPSPGRFVPAIGKRLINPSLPHFGMHPGIKANPYIEETAKLTEDEMIADFNQRIMIKFNEVE